MELGVDIDIERVHGSSRKAERADILLKGRAHCAACCSASISVRGGALHTIRLRTPYYPILEVSRDNMDSRSLLSLSSGMTSPHDTAS